MTKNISLVRGFKRKQGDEQVDVMEIEMREPSSGELRGLKIFDVVQMDVNACRQLVPRITTMTANDFDSLSPKDLTTICNECAAFFVE